MASWIWGTSQFDEEVDKATSELLPSDQEDIALNLEICDQIKAKMVQPKDAMRALKRRLNHKNPNVQLLALTLTDICVKNGGNHFLMEISSREFMDNLVSIVKIVSLNNDVKNRILRFIQNWAVAFEGKPEFAYVNTVYKTLVSEGYKFPPKDLAIANNAMTDTAIAPEWIDSDVCLRCRDPFTFTNRKHHCRNCGQVFDQKCSSKTLPLPHFGIPQEVRVCDSCHFRLTRKKEAAAKEAEDAQKKGLRQQIRHENIDYDLARAIELSLKESQGGRAGYAPLNEVPKPWVASEPPLVQRTERRQGEEDDEDLRAAIEASLREAHAPQPSAPPVADPTITNAVGYDSPVALVPSYDLAPVESDAIMTFNQTVAEAQTYGMRDLRQTHELYRRATASQPKLTRSLDDTERKEQLLSEMHEKLSQAVKLYDNLLAEQFTQSTRRQQALSQPSYPQYNQYQSTQQPPAQSQQWAPQPTSSSPYPTAYTSQSPLPVASSAAQEQNRASNTIAYRPQANSPSPVQSRAPYQQDYVSAQPSALIAQLTQYSTQQQPVHVPSLPPVTLPLSPGLNQTGYQPTLITHPTMVSQPSAPVPPTPLPTAPQQHPAQQHAYQNYPVGNHTLGRSNTIASAPQRQQQPQQPYANHPHYQQQQQQQQQRVAQPSAPVSLPVLPTAPTNAPSAYNLYSPAVAVPTAPTSEPKEAMLISFD